MPKSMLKNLPAQARDIWEQAFKDAQKKGYSDEQAAKVAWGAVKRAGFRQDEEGGRWHKMELAPFYITKAVKGGDGVMRWSATVSEFAIDRQGDEMTPQFIKSAVAQVESGLRPAPVVCISHIDHGRPSDSWVAGDVTDLYVDGDTPKAKGTFRDTDLGRAAFDAVRTDYVKKRPQEERARISLGFFADIIEPLEIKADNGATIMGRRFKSGWVKHLAITRVPVVKTTNITAELELKSMAPKTKKQDAASIVGDELADKLVDMAVKSDLEDPNMPGLILKQEDDTPAEDPQAPETDQAPAAGDPQAPEAGIIKAEADPAAQRLDQIEAMLNRLLAAIGLEEMEPEEAEANRVALGNAGTNPPTTVKGAAGDDAARAAAQLMDGWGEDNGEDEGGELYEFSDYSDYDFTVIRFIDDWGDRVKAALLSDGDRTEKVAAVQKALYDFGEGVEGLIKDATPPSSRDLADVVAEAVRAAVTPVYNELAAVKAQLENVRAGGAEGQRPIPKALDNNAIVLETALQSLMGQNPAGGPPSGLGSGRTMQAKSASDLAWESTDPALGGQRRPY